MEYADMNPRLQVPQLPFPLEKGNIVPEFLVPFFSCEWHFRVHNMTGSNLRKALQFRYCGNQRAHSTVNGRRSSVCNLKNGAHYCTSEVWVGRFQLQTKAGSWTLEASGLYSQCCVFHLKTRVLLLRRNFFPETLSDIWNRCWLCFSVKTLRLRSSLEGRNRHLVVRPDWVLSAIVSTDLACTYHGRKQSQRPKSQRPVINLIWEWIYYLDCQLLWRQSQHVIMLLPTCESTSGLVFHHCCYCSMVFLANKATCRLLPVYSGTHIPKAHELMANGHVTYAVINVFMCTHFKSETMLKRFSGQILF